MPYITKTLISSEGCDASHDKRLSICLLADGFSFAQLSMDGELLSFCEAAGQHSSSMTDMTRDLMAYFAEMGVRPLAFRSMSLTLISNESVWVPDEVYQVGSNRHYMRLVGGSGQSLMTAQCPSLASTAVFSYNDQLPTAFKVALPGLNVANQHVRFAALAQQFNGSTVLLSHWRNGYVDLAAYRNGQYVFGNTIPFADESTALFLLIDAMKSYGVESEGTSLLMCGDVSRERYARFRPYFPTVSLFSGVAKAGARFRTFHAYRHALTLV